jgi:hypothetical protein
MRERSCVRSRPASRSAGSPLNSVVRFYKVTAEIIKLENRCQIIDKLEKRNIYRNKSVIAIDGATLTGKSNLSYFLGSELVIKVFNLDNFVKLKQDCYTDSLSLDIVKPKVELFYRKKPFVIEGVCLLKVLEKLEVKPDVLIYCRKLSQNNGAWTDEYLYDRPDENSLREILKNYGGVDAEIIKYHYKYKPFLNADFIYERVAQ